MKQKKLKLTCGKHIDIYQNLFSLAERSYFAEYALNSFFKLGGGSNKANKLKGESYFSCVLSTNDEENFGLTNFPVIKKLFKKYNRKESWINATHHGSIYYTHTDIAYNSSNKEDWLTLLYCVNLSWDTEQGGEIMFFNDIGEKEIAVDFIPGQLIAFDSSIGHRAAFSYGHIEPRIMYVCKLKSI